jgi:hypothetical protein
MLRNMYFAVGIVVAMGWMTWVQFPRGARDISILKDIQTVSGAHPTSHREGIGGAYLEHKAGGA